jgi:hypothetical protein
MSKLLKQQVAYTTTFAALRDRKNWETQTQDTLPVFISEAPGPKAKRMMPSRSQAEMPAGNPNSIPVQMPSPIDLAPIMTPQAKNPQKQAAQSTSKRLTEAAVAREQFVVCASLRDLPAVQNDKFEP